MKPNIKAAITILSASLILTGCSPAKLASTTPPALNQTERSPEPSPVVAASNSGQPLRPVTPAGQKISDLQKDSQRLKAQFAVHETEYRRIKAVMLDSSQRYFNATGEIRAQLEVGSTPGNPLLQQQWERARLELDRVAAVMTDLNQLTAKLGDDGALVAYLIESIQATYRLGGAMDADHEALIALSDDVNREAVLVERLATQVAEALARQSAHLSNERNTISSLQSAVKVGELYTTSLMSLGLGNGAGPATPPATNEPKTSPASFTSSRSDPETARQLLYTIGFDRSNPNFQQQLYNVVNAALTKNPTAQFDLVTVISGGANGGNPANLSKAQRNTQTVLRALTDMGMPLNRIRTEQTTEANGQFNQVKVYSR
ncbi:MAG: hypothetical protein ORO03_05590 [Alphaproteobacteria bacterium]|nr:hypothetical protein [Alphaproteobacteria bacterium]